MRKLVYKLHKRSEGARKRLSFGIALGTTLVVFVVWLSVTGLETAGEQFAEETAGGENTQLATPLASIAEDIENIGIGLKVFFSRFRNEQEADLEVVENSDVLHYPNEVEYSVDGSY